MFIVDFTRIDDEIDFDLIAGKDGGEARNRAIDYIMDYAFANDGIYLDKRTLDANFEPNDFSYKAYMKNIYDIDVSTDLITGSFYSDYDYMVFLKYIDINSVKDNRFYILHNDLEESAPHILTLLINDRLVEKYADDLDTYEELKLNTKSKTDSFQMDGIKASVISLYNGGLFLEELLNNAVSYKQLKDEDFGGIEI